MCFILTLVKFQFHTASTMAPLYRLRSAHLFAIIILSYDSINMCVDSLDTSSGGFRLSQLNSRPEMTSLTCSSAHLPRDVTDFYHINIRRHPMSPSEGGKSEVIASLKPHGE